MSQPFSQLNVLGTGTQGQEVTLHIQGGIFLLEEVLGSIGIIRERVVHVRGVRRGVGYGTRLGRLSNWRRSRTSIVHLRGVIVVVLVVIASAESLAAESQSNDRSVFDSWAA